MKKSKFEYLYIGYLIALIIAFIVLQDIGYNIWGSGVDSWEMSTSRSSVPDFYYFDVGGHRPTHK